MSTQNSLANLSVVQALVQPKTVVFIDAGVKQPNVLAQGVIPGAEVHFLSSNENAIAKITLTLSDRSDLGAVHLISHGASGRILLGNGELNLTNLTDHTAELSKWFSASQANAPELLIYGCNVATGDAGAAFIDQLQAIAGVTVAAADHVVGSPLQGGQWELNRGNASAPLALSLEAQNRYVGTFALAAGDLAVIAYGADNEAFSLLALADIAEGEVIFITDEGFDANTGRTFGDESRRVLTVGTGGITAGTILTQSNLGDFGTVTGDPINFDSEPGDQLLIYQTSDNTAAGDQTFVYGFNNSDVDGTDVNGWQATLDGVGTSNAPTGLTQVTAAGSGGTAFGLLTEVDNAYYNGPTTGDQATLLAAISDPANWVTNDEIGGETGLDFGQAPTSFGVNNGSSNPGFVVVAPGSLSTTETGGTDTFTVRLATQPTGNVTLTFSSTDDSEATVSGPITFTASDWFTPQTVTVTGQNDDFDSVDGNYTINAAVSGDDTTYNALSFDPISGVTPDDDTAGFSITNIQGTTVTDPGNPIPIPLTTEAGGIVSFDIALDSEPDQDVTITFTSSDETEGTVTNQVVFTARNGDTPSNWNVAQTVTATGQDDALADGDVDYTITAAVSTQDTNYSALEVPTVTVRNSDNETAAAGITFTPISGNTTEDLGTATFTVVLNSQPTDDVTLSFTSNDEGEGTVTNQVVFNSQDWDQAQTVTVTGVDDAVVDGDITYGIQTAVQSNDSAYSALTGIADVSVINTDNDGNRLKDFNGDGNKDLLWINRNSGSLAYWSILEVSDSPSSITANFLTTDSTAGQDVIGTADFNGDGQSDILLRNNAQDVNTVLIMNGTEQASSITIGANLSIPTTAWRMRAAGNFDNDSQTEILWRNVETGGFALWDIAENNDATPRFVDISAIGLGATGVLSNLSWEIQAAQDIDGDGRDEIFWRNTQTGGNAIWSLDESGAVESSVFIDQLAATNWNIVDAADYTNDGVVDIAWRNATTGQNAIWTMQQTEAGYRLASANFIPSLSSANWSVANQQVG